METEDPKQPLEEESAEPAGTSADRPPERTDTPPATKRSDYQSTVHSSPAGNDHSSRSLSPADVTNSSPEHASRLGTYVGKYKIERLLGAGGMGVVYAARDSIIGREVAIKFLSPEAASNETSLKRFVQEARAVGQLQHPNVVALYDVDQTEGTWYLVMEMVDGGTASDLIEREGAIPWQKSTRIIADVCRGLMVAHEKELIHRDIKPDNIMLSADGTAKLSDFGLAKIQNYDAPTLTRQNSVLGTPHYMSPEQCRSADVDARSDIYSLGATFFDLLTGSPPFARSTDVMQIMYAQCHEPTPDPAELAVDLPPLCRGIIEQAMAKEPENRYQTAAEMFDDLEALLEGTTDGGSLSGSRTGRSRASRRSDSRLAARGESPTRRWRNYYLWGTVAVLTLLIALAPFYLNRHPERDGGSNGGTATPPSSSAEETPPSAAVPAPAPKGPPIKIGILHSLSGTMAVSENGVVDAALLAVEELNARGGVIGRPVEAVVADGRSQDDHFAQEARRLIEQEQVVTLFGCWTSSSRKRVKSVVEQLDHLLIYPVQSEGLEQSPNIVYTGASPNQQIIPAINWAYAFQKKRRFYLVGSDYVFPRAAGAIIKDELREMGLEPVGESYVPLGHTEFKEVVAEIVKTKPDMILNTINGQSNLSFFHELRAAGIQSSDVPTISFSIAEPELRNLDTAKMAGDYAAWSYFQALDTAENKDFVRRFQKRYNATRSISDPMEAGYYSVLLWAQAVEQAGALDVAKIRAALRGQSTIAPEGEVRIDPETGHTWKVVRIGQVEPDGNFSIIWSSAKPHEPEPFPDTRTPEQWKQFLQDLYDGWQGNWAAPAR